MEKDNITGRDKLKYRSRCREDDRISGVFRELSLRGHKAFIPFLTCGFPDTYGFYKLFETLDSQGADIIEIGLPFSDPLADGPVIQATSKAALEQGMNTDKLFGCIEHLREKTSTPIVVLVYFNNVFVYGVGKFLKRLSGAGADGIIIPDLPLSEYKEYIKYFGQGSVDNIMIVSPTTDHLRLKDIADAGKGFLYCVSLKGVTGVRKTVSPEVKSFLRNVRDITDIPLALGFGISGRKQVKEVAPYCDGVIIGSKILSLVLEAGDFESGLKKVRDFSSGINAVLKPGLL
ncbi:MAG: tryptophan synthase subunit alpha [Actinobacteria bacterium]|nr:tryptophan synthase subunit alpha [Actinomycetota bacterium]